MSNHPRGMYFHKKEFSTKKNEFESIKHLIPSPILENDQDTISCYWYAVKLAFKNTHIPEPNSGFVSSFIDAAFNDDIFMWDTAFMTFYCNLLHPYIPGIQSLDNFYVKQFDDGEIPREMIRKTGEDYPKWVNHDCHPLHSFFHNDYGYRRIKQVNVVNYENMFKPSLGRSVEEIPYLTLDNLNHPIMAWAEWESYIHTGDLSRLQQVIEPLYHYYLSLYTHIRHASHLYVTDWASMDNSPRNAYLGCAVDTSSEMVLFANHLIEMMCEVENKAHSSQTDYSSRIQFLKESSELTKHAIQSLLWNDRTKFYYDLSKEYQLAPVKTVAAYWTLLSDVATQDQVKHLVDYLNDEKTFKRVHRIPVLAADEEGYNPRGGYWRGAVWAPTNTMVLSGLKKKGYHELAREIALNHLGNIVEVYKKTNTIWECYPADEVSSGDSDKRDLVGWSGLGPILYLIEYRIGLTADSRTNTVTWRIEEGNETTGCNNYWFFNKSANFLQTQQDNKLTIKVDSKDSFNLDIIYKKKTHHYQVKENVIIHIGE